MNELEKNIKLAKPLSEYKPGVTVRVNDKMQKNYSYRLVAAPGRISDPEFRPALTPSRMLELGVFEGKYLNDCYRELPREWYERALRRHKLSPVADPGVNCFGVKSRLSLGEWRRRGWIPINAHDRDPRGWFQWYCRYWLGRRIPELDQVQIARWKKFRRHRAQVDKNCGTDLTCRPRQRQALLQWSYNPF